MHWMLCDAEHTAQAESKVRRTIGGVAGLSSADVPPRVKTNLTYSRYFTLKSSVLLLLLLLGQYHLAMMPSLLQSEWLRNTAAMPTCRDSASSHSLLHNAPFD